MKKYVTIFSIDGRGERMSVHLGHRKRMIDRLRTEKLYEHEQLEILLFNGLPRQNTNELAHRLLAKFGTTFNAVTAPMEELEKVEGIGANLAGYIKLFGDLLVKAMEAQLKKEAPRTYRGLYESKSFTAYLSEHFKEETMEIFEVYFLDSKRNVYFYSRFLGENNHSVMFRPEELARLLVELKPAGVVVAHNHPLGTQQPSLKDDENTQQCRLLCNMHNVMFCDHIVCGTDGCFSYYDHGKLSDDDAMLF